MNDEPKDSKEGYLVDLIICTKSISTPAKKEVDHNLPRNKKELRERFDEFKSEKGFDLKEFNNILIKCRHLITDSIIINMLKTFVPFLKKNILFFDRPTFKLIEIIEDPNIILNSDKKEESILMILCDISNYDNIFNYDNNYNIYEMISILFKKKINLNVNYEDKLGRNALFYLKSGKYDEKIIKLLVENKIKVDHKDKEGNTALHHIINNNEKTDLIYKLINIGNANFMIKNKQNESCLDLINTKLISKKNLSQNVKGNVYNFAEIKKLIQLIKRKLSFKITDNNFPQSNDLNLSNINLNSQNLYKIPSLSFNKNNNEIQKNNDETMTNNIFLALKKNSTLIINTTKFEEKKNNNISFAQKIEQYKQLNRNKKTFLNFLKNSENYLKEKAKLIKTILEEKKNELEQKKNELKIMKENNIKKFNEFDIELKTKKSEIHQINNMIKQTKKELGQNLIKIKDDSLYLYKYEHLCKNNNIDENYIFSQLRKDLNDYPIYIYHQNEKLNIVINKIYTILINCIRNCLGENCQLKIYGSRATKMCLPWSDIDFVIETPFNNSFYNELELFYNYLKQNINWSITYIGSAKMPIIKIKTNDEFHNLTLDISMEIYSHRGQQCVEYINKKIMEYSPLKPLTLALKTIFYNAHINEPYNGGLSSYGIILLIIYFLQKKRNEGKDVYSMNNIGKLFFELLHFYKDRNNINQPLFITNNYLFSPFAQYSTNSLVIVDPLDSTNNVAKNARDLNKILYTFQVAVIALYDSCECGCHYQHESSIKELGCDHNLLNRIFNATKNLKDFSFKA